MTSTAPSRNHHHHKPLHNFSLPFLNWGQKPSTTSNRRNRFPTSTPTTSHADVITRKTRHHHHHINKHPQKTTPSDDVITRKRAHSKHPYDDVIVRTDSHRSRNRHRASKSTSEDDVIVRKDARKLINSDYDDDVIRTDGEKLVDVDVAAAVEVELKPWKLRPRKSVNGKGEVNGNGDGEGGGGGVRSGRLLRTVEVVAADQVAAAEEEDREKMMKRRLWISLSKDEIEHDILLFTGAKPVRRPKKRNKIAQKHLDSVFPGLYLVGMSADSYRV